MPNSIGHFTNITEYSKNIFDLVLCILYQQADLHLNLRRGTKQVYKVFFYIYYNHLRLYPEFRTRYAN